MKIEINDLVFGYKDSNPVLKGIDLEFDDASLICILGPNGVGKSTLLYCINKLVNLTSGTILIDGKDLKDLSFKDLSTIMSFVPHSEDSTFSMSVMDTVLMGRHPYSGFNYSDKDLAIAASNIKLLGLEEFSMRDYGELSAGQHQKVMIARGLTQEPKILMLDEPTANLDVRYQMLVMRLLRDIARIKGIMVLVICHDLNVTSMYADRIVLLSQGKVYADGTAEEVITRENVKDVYNIDCEITTVQGRPHVSLLDDDSLDSHIEAKMKALD